MAKDKDASKEAVEANEDVEVPEAKPDPYQDLKAFMETRGVKSPDDFSDYLTGLETTEHWKKQYGDSQNQVGELRREMERIKSQVSSGYEQQYGEQPVNLRGEIKSVLGEFFNEYQQQQAANQMKYIQERSELMKRPGWKDVQPYFDQALQSPEVALSLQSGRLTQERLYSQINERVLMSKINSFVQSIPEGAMTRPGPNTETSDRIKQPIPEQEARKQRMAKAIENQDVESLLKDLIPDNDPIARF